MAEYLSRKEQGLPAADDETRKAARASTREVEKDREAAAEVAGDSAPKDESTQGLVDSPEK